MFITEEKILKKIFQERSRGNLEKARKHALKGYDRWPGNFDICLELIQLYMESSDFHEAVKYMKSAVKNDPGRKSEIIQFATEYFYQSSDPFLGSFIIESHIRNSDIESVRKFLGGVSEKYVDSLIKRSRTKSQSFVQRGDTVGSAFTDNELLLGLLHAENSQFSEAAVHLGNALRNCPEQAEKIGFIMLEIQREIPGSAELEFHLGLASVYLNHPDKAERRFFNTIGKENAPLESILEVLDNHEMGENSELLRGETLLRLEREKEGINTVRGFLSDEETGWNEQPEDRIKQLFPAHVDRKSMVYDRLCLLPEELLYRKDTIFLLCDICSDLSNYMDAAKLLARLAEISPEDSGEVIRWIESRENVMQTSPSQKLLATLYLREGRYEQARDHFGTSAEMDPEVTPELIQLIKDRMDEKGREAVLIKILIDLYTRIGESERAHSLLQELRDEERLDGSEAMQMTTRVMESCGATVDNIVSAVEFSAGRNEPEELVSHLAEFCGNHPEKAESLAAKISRLANDDSGIYPFAAELLGRTGREIKLPEPLKYLQAVALLHSGEIEKAVFSFDQIIMFNEDIKLDVMAEYEKVIEDNYSNSTLLLALYQMHFDEQNYVPAAHYLGKYLESDHTQIRDVITRFEHIAERACLETGIWKEMLESALSINHGNLAHQILERAVSAMGEAEAAPLHIYGARLYRENRDIEQALKCLAIALTSQDSDLRAIERELDDITGASPDNPVALYLCGETCLRRGAEEKAVENFRRCIRTSPEYTGRVREKLEESLPYSVQPWLINRLLGSIAWKEGKRAKSISFFSEAQNGAQGNLQALGGELEDLLQRNSEDTDIRKLYTENLRLEGRFPEAVSQIEVLLESHSFSTGEALCFLRLITGEEPFQFEGNRLLAGILIESGKIEESLKPAVNMMNSADTDPAVMEEAADRLFQVHRDNADFILRYGSVKLRAGKEEEAIGYLREALENERNHCEEILEILSGHSWPPPHSTGSGILRADCLIESGEYRKAFDVLESVGDDSESDMKEALERIELLLSKQPLREYYSLALKIKARLHDFSGASETVESAESALESDQAVDLKIELAGLADIQGLHREASALYSEVLEESGDRNRIYKLIENSLTDLARTRLEEGENRKQPGGGDIQEAAVLIDTALDFGLPSRAMDILKDSGLPEGRRIYNMGRIYLAMDKPSLAVSMLSSCMNRSSLTGEERIQALYALGRGSEMIFDFGRAASAFMKILEIRGEYRDASRRARVNYTRCLEDERRIFIIEKSTALSTEIQRKVEP